MCYAALVGGSASRCLTIQSPVCFSHEVLLCASLPEDPTANKSSGQESESIPEYTAEEEREDNRLWRTVVIGEQEQRIDMKVIEPYRRVISHGGTQSVRVQEMGGANSSFHWETNAGPVEFSVLRAQSH